MLDIVKQINLNFGLDFFPVSALPIPLDAGRLGTQELAPFSESRKSDEGYYDSAVS